MTSNLYLILHKVRGLPAFDIATMLIEGPVEGSEAAGTPEPLWIIPTSGHRAYPWWSLSLSDIAWGLDVIGLSYNELEYATIMSDAPLICPDDARDHYAASEPRAPKAVARPQPATQTEDFLV